MGLQKIVSLLVLLLLTSCGSKKKTITKTDKLQEVSFSETINTNINRVSTDSTLTLLNIVSLNIVALDSTQPIKIQDSNGNVTTFYNVKEINSTKDNSIVRNNVHKQEDVVVKATAGTTTTIKENTTVKDKLKIDTTIIYIVISIIVLFALRKYIRRIFIPI